MVGPLHTASKAAVTMLRTQYAKALPGIKFDTADPGYTAADFNRHSGHQTVAEGTDAVVALATVWRRTSARSGRRPANWVSRALTVPR